MKYASTTSVPVARSKEEIERLLSRYGADQFVQGWSEAAGAEGARAVIGFRAKSRQVRFDLPLPARADFKSNRAGTMKWEQAQRQRWRALALVVKAKLEAVETGITTFEQEFLAHIVIPGKGITIGEWLGPQVEAAYIHGKVLPLLPGLTTEKP